MGVVVVVGVDGGGGYLLCFAFFFFVLTDFRYLTSLRSSVGDCKDRMSVS